MPLTDGLVGYWKCDEASGNLIDAHGANTLTAVNAPGSTTGKLNGGRDLESGSAQYFTHADNADLSLGSDTDFTWSFWLKPETNSMSYGIITKAKTSVVGFDDYAYRIESHAGASGKAQFIVGNDVSYVALLSNSYIYVEAQWYFIVCWHDSVLNKIFLQVNNDTPAEAAWSGGTFDDNGTFYLGSLDGGASPCDGVIDEILFAKRVYTADERTTLYGGGTPPAYPFGAGGSTARPDYYYRAMRAA